LHAALWVLGLLSVVALFFTGLAPKRSLVDPMSEVATVE
jgi:hypothetical protein